MGAGTNTSSHEADSNSGEKIDADIYRTEVSGPGADNHEGTIYRPEVSGPQAYSHEETDLGTYTPEVFSPDAYRHEKRSRHL